MSTPEIYLQTAFTFDAIGRILTTREPGPAPGPFFVLVRGAAGRAWAVQAGLPPALAAGLNNLAASERPAADFADPPRHAERYQELVDTYLQPTGSRSRLFAGPAFTFPQLLPDPGAFTTIDDERQLARHFSGWAPGEITAGRAPMVAIFSGADPVSICFSARRSPAAAEAGLETAPAFRGRGLGPRAAAAWAAAVRLTGRVPLYSTSWGNTASLAVARKLGLAPYAAVWSLSS